MTPNGHLDPSLPLGGHLGPAGTMGTAPRLSLQPDPALVALDSRKSSVMSLGRMSYDQRSLVSPVMDAHCWKWGALKDCGIRCPGKGTTLSSLNQVCVNDNLSCSGPELE